MTALGGGRLTAFDSGTVWDNQAVKACSKCGTEKSLEDFPPRKTSRDGRHGWCRPCYRLYYGGAMQRWREANRSQDRENQRRWRQENLDAALAREQRSREKHREALRERDRRRRLENPERIRENYRRWRESHREQELIRQATRRALTSNDPELKALVADLLTLACAYCGATDNITVDHVIPLSKGGKHEANNLAPACLPCNSSKNDRLLSEWSGRAAA